MPAFSSPAALCILSKNFRTCSAHDGAPCLLPELRRRRRPPAAQPAPPRCHPLSPPPQVMRRYHIQDRDDYGKYNKLCGMVTKLVATLKRLDPKDSTRIDLTDQLLNK